MGGGWRVDGEGCRVQGVGCRVEGAGCRVQNVGSRVMGVRFKGRSSWCGGLRPHAQEPTYPRFVRSRAQEKHESEHDRETLQKKWDVRLNVWGLTASCTGNDMKDECTPESRVDGVGCKV